MTQALQALVLGIIQGLTEFIPVSSSGHLVVAPRVFGWDELGLSFDVAIHIGTLLALLVFFRSQWLDVIKGFFSSLRARPGEWSADQRLAWMLILATIPVAVAGFFLSDVIEENIRTPAYVALFLFAGGIAMLAAERWGSRSRGFDRLRPADAAVVGLAQALALAPGVSRSGITITGGMLAGLDREAAARFAFMISAPAIAGAGLWQGLDLAREGLGGTGPGAFAVGMLASALTGFFTIKYLLAYLARHTLLPFIIYRFALAAVIVIVLALS